VPMSIGKSPLMLGRLYTRLFDPPVGLQGAR
jgi:hypothetical protein